MRIVRLTGHMVRYRSALVLVLFTLFGAVWHQTYTGISLPLLLAFVALIATYTMATSLNDIADYEIDRINLIGHNDRPLVTSGGTKRDLTIVAAVAAAVAVSTAFMASPLTGLLIIVSLVLYAQYSLPPLQISRRPLATPLFLATGYTLIPYVIGVDVTGGHLGQSDVLIMPAILFLFLARITLKDFRDRDGDARGGKSTILLRYGKGATCGLSLASFLVGSVLMLTALQSTPLFAALLVPFIGGLTLIEVLLWRARRVLTEVILVSLGARVGNGMLFTLLGALLLHKAGADVVAQLAWYATASSPYVYFLAMYLRNPEAFQFGNRDIHNALDEQTWTGRAAARGDRPVGNREVNDRTLVGYGRADRGHALLDNSSPTA
jgi:4-hydroxybenzoate polyprenyltransferase